MSIGRVYRGKIYVSPFSRAQWWRKGVGSDGCGEDSWIAAVPCQLWEAGSSSRGYAFSVPGPPPCPAPVRAVPHEPLYYPLSVPLIALILTGSWWVRDRRCVHAYMHEHGSTVNSVYERLSGIYRGNERPTRCTISKLRRVHHSARTLT